MILEHPWSTLTSAGKNNEFHLGVILCIYWKLRRCFLCFYWIWMRNPTFHTCQVCEECITERESCELMRKLNYSNEDICVCFIRGKEPPKSILNASSNILEPNRRTSKRSRKTAFGNSVNLNVSGSTSVYQLKMMIWEAFGVWPLLLFEYIAFLNLFALADLLVYDANLYLLNTSFVGLHFKICKFFRWAMCCIGNSGLKISLFDCLYSVSPSITMNRLFFYICGVGIRKY